MDINSILARVASGFAVKAAAIGLAVYVVQYAYGFIVQAFEPIAGVM